MTDIKKPLKELLSDLESGVDTLAQSVIDYYCHKTEATLQHLLQSAALLEVDAESLLEEVAVIRGTAQDDLSRSLLIDEG